MEIVGSAVVQTARKRKKMKNVSYKSSDIGKQAVYFLSSYNTVETDTILIRELHFALHFMFHVHMIKP